MRRNSFEQLTNQRLLPVSQLSLSIHSGRSKGIGLNQGPVVRGVAREMPVTLAEVTSEVTSTAYTIVRVKLEV